MASEARDDARREGDDVQANTQTMETILVVDDQPLVRDVVRESLESVGYRVLAAEDGPAALAAAGAEQRPPQLLLADVVMPAMSGRELAETLRRKNPELRVLLMSGYTADRIGRHGVLEGGADFIQKPFGIAALASKVRQVLDGPA